MQESLSNWIITGLVACYLVLHGLQHHCHLWWPLQYYGKDLLLIPLITAASTRCCQLVQLPLPTKKVLLWQSFLYVSVMFEGVFPLVGMAFAPDLADILCYAFGAACSYLLIPATNIHMHRRATDCY